MLTKKPMIQNICTKIVFILPGTKGISGTVCR